MSDCRNVQYVPCVVINFVLLIFTGRQKTRNDVIKETLSDAGTVLQYVLCTHADTKHSVLQRVKMFPLHWYCVLVHYCLCLSN
jgi:hypothetical protein